MKTVSEQSEQKGQVIFFAQIEVNEHHWHHQHKMLMSYHH